MGTRLKEGGERKSVTNKRIFIYIYMYVYIYMYIYLSIYLSVHILYKAGDTHTHTHTHMHIRWATRLKEEGERERRRTEAREMRRIRRRMSSVPRNRRKDKRYILIEEDLVLGSFLLVLKVD